MASPPVDPVISNHGDDSYLISGRDMEILRKALHFKSDNERLNREIESLLDELEECRGR